MFTGGKFRFLNREEELQRLGWDDNSLDKLWRYNLHYFDDLNAYEAQGRASAHRALIENWIQENEPGKGTGWEPYPTSLRLVNWIKWFALGHRPSEVMLHSAAVQARWLRRRLEHHLQGNHLFVNYKAMAFAGLFFDGAEAKRWLALALRGLLGEIDEQVLADGGQFERSPMYHALALEDLLDLLNIFNCYAPTSAVAVDFVRILRQRIPLMMRWLRCMTHPDGQLAQFNDSAPGIAPDNGELESYARSLGVEANCVETAGVTFLKDSGYVRVEREDVVVILDVAPVGPDYLPGHAHADTLSMEFSVGGRRVVTNGGTSCYGSGARRMLERSTAAHSTVEVAGLSSSEVWGGFRVGRRARIENLSVSDDAIEASHDGYRFLHGAPRHRRRWEFSSRAMRVLDQVAPGSHDAVARYHLAPGLRLAQLSAGQFEVRDGIDTIVSVEIRSGLGRIGHTERATAFGVLVPAETLEVSLTDGLACAIWRW